MTHEQEHVVQIASNESTHSMGLLGATVTAEEWRLGGIAYLKERRLHEIERRILALESYLERNGK